MSLLLDQQYAGMIAPYVRNYVKKGLSKYNFSCPFCGDSQTIKTRARGYLLPAKGDYLAYYCHNCNIPGQSLQSLLKHLDHNLYQQYIVDRFKEKGGKKQEEDPRPTFKKPKFARRLDRNLIKVSSLKSHHPVRKYLYERQIPTTFHHKLYWIDEFKKWANKVDPGTFNDTSYEEGRLVIPLIDNHNNVLGYQGRRIEDSEYGLKYITILLRDDNPKIYGLDTVNKNTKVRAFEGPIDSMFIDNSVAAAGGRIDSLLADLGFSKDRTVVVYDNEPRSKHTIKKMLSAVDSGWKVCVWPSNLQQTDVNKMIIEGYTSDQLTQIIDDNTYEGLMAKSKISQWRKV